MCGPGARPQKKPGSVYTKLEDPFSEVSWSKPSAVFLPKVKARQFSPASDVTTRLTQTAMPPEGSSANAVPYVAASPAKSIENSPNSAYAYDTSVHPRLVSFSHLQKDTRDTQKYMSDGKQKRSIMEPLVSLDAHAERRSGVFFRIALYVFEFFRNPRTTRPRHAANGGDRLSEGATFDKIAPKHRFPVGYGSGLDL